MTVMFVDTSGYCLVEGVNVQNSDRTSNNCSGGTNQPTINGTGGERILYLSETVTVKERQLLEEFPPRTVIIAVDSKLALSVSKGLGPDFGSLNDGKADAFRHAYWSALLAIHISPKFALEYTNAHENWFGNPLLSMEMDLHNNGVGINLGSELNLMDIPELKSLILGLISNGELLYIKDGKLVPTNE